MDIDVAVIGASSAGLYAAEQLARAGRRVTLFERQPTLAPARRSLIVTPQIERQLGKLPDAVVLHRTPLMEMVSPHSVARVQLDPPDLVVERRALTEHLAERAVSAGAQILFGHRFKALAPADDGAELELHCRDGATQSVRVGAVIGADGVFSAVAAAAGLPRPPLVQIIQAEVALPAAWDARVTRVWFDADATRYFYWLIPESEERGVLGVIANEAASTRALLERFMERQGLQPLAYQASHVAMYHPSLRPYSSVGAAPVLLVGDAAGQVKVTTVGGSVTGFYGAAAAAHALLQPVSPRRALRTVKRELDTHWALRALLERLDNAGYDRLLNNITPAVQAFLGHRNRDQMAGGIWRLLLLRPQLLSLGLAALRPRKGVSSQPPPDQLPASKTESS